MTEWTPEAVREWLFTKLYPAYMQDSRGHMTFNNAPSDEPEPQLPDTVRECKMLEAAGHAEILGETWGSIHVRLTVAGRVFWESLTDKQTEPAEQPREPLGFETEGES